MSGNGQLEEAKAERERERDHDTAMSSVQNGQGQYDADRVYRDILKDLTETDALPPGSKNLLKNMVTKDWVLANLNEPDINEIRWQLRIKLEKFKALHPASESVLQGDFRAYVYDDPQETLTALSDAQALAAENFFDNVWLRVTRSRDFAQQEIMRTSISQTEVHRPEHDTSGDGLLGRFR